MARLLNFLSFFPATTVLLWLHTEGALAIYTASYGLAYVGAKGFESWNARKEQSETDTQ